jgi:hypothetical protein
MPAIEAGSGPPGPARFEPAARGTGTGGHMATTPVVPEISVAPSRYEVPQAFSLVIFGASGDLM